MSRNDEYGFLVFGIVDWFHADILNGSDIGENFSTGNTDRLEAFGGDWYWFDSKGYAIHDTWKQIKGHWYYFKTDCRMVKGWRKVDGKWYYLSKQASKDYPEGSMRDGWLMDGRYWYYLNPKKGGPRGAMCTGFVTVNGQTYYCRPKAEAGYPEGSMVTGKKMIDGKEYYFEADGRMKNKESE